MRNTEPALLMPHHDFANVRLLCCDVDGVLTDGGLYYGDSGERLKRFHVLDGQGLKDLQKAGVKTCFISQSRNASIKVRAADLGIDFCFAGIENKRDTISQVLADLSFEFSQVVHIADDVNDLSLLEAVGIAVTVPNGMRAVKNICRYVTAQNGGHGAVRELCETIMTAKSIVRTSNA